MHDEDEDEDDDDDYEDDDVDEEEGNDESSGEDDEEDGDAAVTDSSSDSGSQTESVSEGDIDLDPLDKSEDAQDEEQLLSPRQGRSGKGSTRDELPRTDTRMNDFDEAVPRALQIAEHRDLADTAKSSTMLSLDVPEHQSSMAAAMVAMRADAALTDVHVVCKDGAKIPAHRAVLAAASAHLRASITALSPLSPGAAEGADAKGATPTKARGNKAAGYTSICICICTHKQTHTHTFTHSLTLSLTHRGCGGMELQLGDVNVSDASALLDFIYTGSVKVEEQQLPGLLAVSDKLGVVGLRDACCQHLLKQLSPDTALRTRALGQALGADDLFQAAHHMVMEEFLDVAQTNSFLELDEPTLKELIDSDDLLVNSEQEVLDAVIKWTEAKEPERGGASLLRLMTSVRLGLLSLDVLGKKVAAHATIHRLLAADPQWQSMLNTAIAYVGSSKEMRGRMQSAQMRERLGSKGRFLVCVGGRKGSSSKPLRNAWMLDRYYIRRHILYLPHIREQILHM